MAIAAERPLHSALLMWLVGCGDNKLRRVYLLRKRILLFTFVHLFRWRWRVYQSYSYNHWLYDVTSIARRFSKPLWVSLL